jgi:GDP-L-fucose synthase
MVGGALLKRMKSEGYRDIITTTHDELDLRDQAAVNAFFQTQRPEIVVLAAARVGGILANSTRPAEFLYDNLMIGTNIIHASYLHDVSKLLNLGSSCIYPKLAPQPLKEEYLLTGPLEETNRAYAVAKIAAIELCDHYRAQYGKDFVSAMPTNLYGPGDNFNLQSSHVLPALIRKMVDARDQLHPSVEVWGSGKPLREFLHVDDLAEACLFLLNSVSRPGPINVGIGRDLSIRDLASLIAQAVGFNGELAFDSSKPDGTPRKLMDVSLLTSLGWKASINLEDGIRQTVDWYLEERQRQQPVLRQ